MYDDADLAHKAARGRNIALSQRPDAIQRHGRGAPVASIHSIHMRARLRRSISSTPTGGVAKRIFDILISSLILALLALPLAIVATLIRLDSAGPVLFVQRRGGFRGRPFLIYKFRTMKSCDDGPTISQATIQDNRVTRLGAFLRKTSIDELPQLINVLKGDMSLIGPRPHALAHDEAFAKIDQRYRRRFRARPGITGLAQVSGSRGLTDTDQAVHDRVAFDNAYIRTWSLALDAQILMRTALLLLGDKNAY